MSDETDETTGTDETGTDETGESGEHRGPQIWVDADALPNAAREILVRASRKRGVRVTFVRNGYMEKPRAPLTEVILVSQGADVADDRIVEEIADGDLCITSDIPLASRVVEKGATVVTPYGRELDAEAVGEALSVRDFYTELREQGIQTGGPAPYDEGAKQSFANGLDRWITRNVD